MVIFDFLNRECKHEKFSIDREIGYCPDCGELIENQWFMLRCSCCGVKHRAIVKNGKIVPLEKFCENCGSKEFISEQIDRINFIDINYAVHIKKVIQNDVKSFTQTWVDTKETENGKLRLLQQIQ